MQCLTEHEIATWLSDNNVTAAPYGKTESPSHYLQFNCPIRPLTNASFIRQFLKFTNDEILVHITDWPTYERSEMLVIDALRHNWNEPRDLIDAPGHLVPANQRELVVALFGHTGVFEWNAYLYVPNDMATICNWEGELYDFWSKDSSIHTAMTELVDGHGLVRKNAG